VIAEMVVTGIKIFGKATAAAGQQAVRSECSWTYYLLINPTNKLRFQAQT
jgi:hypothetical protein